MSSTPDNLIKRDLETILWGSFNVDSLGPDRYEAIRRRVQDHPLEYLHAFETDYLGSRFDASAASSQHAPTLLRLISPARPDEAKATAARLAQHYDEALAGLGVAEDRAQRLDSSTDETTNMSRRLHSRRVELERELGVSPLD